MKWKWKWRSKTTVATSKNAFRLYLFIVFLGEFFVVVPSSPLNPGGLFPFLLFSSSLYPLILSPPLPLPTSPQGKEAVATFLWRTKLWGEKVDDGNLATCIKKHEGGCRVFFSRRGSNKISQQGFLFCCAFMWGELPVCRNEYGAKVKFASPEGGRRREFKDIEIRCIRGFFCEESFEVYEFLFGYVCLYCQ